MTDAPPDQSGNDQADEAQSEPGTDTAEAAAEEPAQVAKSRPASSCAGRRREPKDPFDSATRRQIVEMAKVTAALNIPDLIPALRTMELLRPTISDAFLQSFMASGVLKDMAQWSIEPPWAGINAFFKNNPALNPALNPVLRWSDQLTPPMLMNVQRSVAADLAAIVTGPSALTGWREALAAQTQLTGVTEMISAITADQRNVLGSVFTNITSLSQLASHNVNVLTPWADLATRYDTLPLAAAPLAAYRRYIEPLEDDPDPHRLRMGALASFGIGGAAASQVLLVDDGDADGDELIVVERVAEQFTDELIAPWRASQIGAAEDLRERLGALDRKIPEMLDGAWAEIDRPGPAQLEKLSQCAVEAIDRTLRAAAPDAAVTDWLAATGLTSGKKLVLYSETGRLTRQARIRYITRDRTSDSKLIENQNLALSGLVGELVSRFNAGKHASAGAMAQARSMLMQVEALLSQLLLPTD